MRAYLLGTLLTIVALLLPVAGGEAAAVKALGSTVIIEAATGKTIPLKKLAQHLADQNGVVFFGEFHDQPALHTAEDALFNSLIELRGGKITLSMEMFERDVQPILDDYLAGKCTEDEFLLKSRPWPRYQTDYRPMIERARKAEIPVLAANVPRSMAAHYAKTGSLEGLDKRWLARHTYAPEGAYRDNFFKTMSEVHVEGMQVDTSRWQAMYQAQCLKDDTMAESIADRLASHPGELIYQVQGDFHGSYHLGVVEKLHALCPEVPITVLAPVLRDGIQSDAALAAANKDRGDYLIIADKY